MLKIIQKQEKEFIWHCPGKKCRDKGTVLLKTKKSFLGEGKIKCSICREEFSFYILMKFNKRNIKRFLEELSDN